MIFVHFDIGTPTPRRKLSQETKRVVDKPPAISFGKSKKENEEIALQNALKSIEKQILGSKLKIEKDAKGRNCRELPKQNCQRLRVNPKPVWKNMTRKICRVPKTKLDKDLVQKVIITISTEISQYDINNKLSNYGHCKNVDINIKISYIAFGKRGQCT